MAIGRAMVRESKVFLFDEPLSKLGASLPIEMRVKITRLHRAFGATMVDVTHDRVKAMTLAGRIVALRSDGIGQMGRPKGLDRHPSNVSGAGFLGRPPRKLLAAEMRGNRCS